MSTCCTGKDAAHPPTVDVRARQRPDGLREVNLLVPEMHCAGCLGAVERAAAAHPGVARARANLTSRRLTVLLDPVAVSSDDLVATLAAAGFKARPVDPDVFGTDAATAGDDDLIRALAVAGFATANIMLLSVSVWAGAEETTRTLFHWLSALIAVPAVGYAGRPFFRSALAALKGGRLNMDVPISLAVLLATGLSLYQAATGGEHAWFDASVMLLFFLLAGRVLEARMRGVSRAAAARLLALAPRVAFIENPDGTVSRMDTPRIEPGTLVLVAAGDSIPLDGEVVRGASDIDRSTLTGEPVPQHVGPGRPVHAGTLNLTAPLTVRVTKAASDTLLAQIVRLTENAESRRGAYVALADRAARVYAPAVHLVALATFTGWLVAGASAYQALTIAIAVLIITCPCALGLAVPATQVVASGALLRRGILLKDGAALERMADADHVVFDKTGTLTSGRPALIEGPPADSVEWRIALGLARNSRHPLAKALAEAGERRNGEPLCLEDVREVPGFGIEGTIEGRTVRLGRADWAAPGADAGEDAASQVWLGMDDRPPAVFRFADRAKVDAEEALAALRAQGLSLTLLSGDRRGAVEETANRLGIEDRLAELSPADKIAAIERLRSVGRKVLMVGDGINDAPALAAASVSMSPASGADITQTAADIVFTGERLQPVPEAVRIARRSKSIVVQNFALAGVYNLIAIPFAVAGFATPLVAAVAMSTSSILVTANALRLARGGRDDALPRAGRENAREAPA